MAKPSLLQQLNEKPGAVYNVPDAQALLSLRHLFDEMMRVNFKDRSVLSRAAPYYRTDRWHNTLYLREPEQQKRGWGAFAFNQDFDNKILWQAPHRYFDVGTGRLAIRWFIDTRALALSLNNVHRYTLASDRKPSDWAHRADTPMMVASEAFAEKHPDGLIIQVHGFEASDTRFKNKSPDIILSQGVKQPSPLVLALQGCLGRHFDVKVYGQDIHLLGATTNMIAQRLRQQGFHRFIHLELSSTLREKLLGNPQLSQQVAHCVSGLL